MSRNLEGNPGTATSRQIDHQLAEGHRLLELDIRTPKELQRAAARRSIWVENNVALLKGCPISAVTKDKLLPQITLDSTDTGDNFESQLQSFQDITKTQMSLLENVRSLIPEPSGDRHAAGGDRVDTQAAFTPPKSPGAGLNDEARLSIKEQLERHPMGFAAILCLACITIVLLVMTWYHNESEKTLINRYETQLNGLRIDFDAKQRHYEETIRKLKEQSANVPAPKNEGTR